MLDPTLSNIRNDLEQQLKSHSSYKFLSISLEIKAIDTLRVLHELIANEKTFFYLENCQQKVAFLGFEILKVRINRGKDRFVDAREFIKDCLANTLAVGAIASSFSCPYFFCNFSFFSDGKIFLPLWQIMGTGDRCFLVANMEIDPKQLLLDERIDDILERVKKKVRQLEQLSNLSLGAETKLSQELKGNYVIPFNTYKSGVEKATAAIASNELEKIVLANALDLKAPQPFQIASSLQVMRQNYPECYLFAVRHGKGATFLGASPELILQTSNSKLIAEAMAGSAPRGKNESQDRQIGNELLQNSKELYEHQVVVEFILNCLGQMGLVPEIAKALSLRKLSNIQHLWTPIEAKLPNNIHPLDILAKLHPTPAMAGIPRDKVLTQLKNYEPFDRLLYAAPLGWVNARDDSEFIVGIRSALIQGDRARLYAGAGIVADSDPDRELAEIQLKFQALLTTLVY